MISLVRSSENVVKGILCNRPGCIVSSTLSNKLGLPLVQASTFDGSSDLFLCFDKDTLQLTWGRASAVGESPFFIDFLNSEQTRRQKQARSELVVKAIGKMGSTSSEVWDLTAGLGRDSILLCNVGWNVKMFERNRILSSLLQNGLHRFITSRGDSLCNKIELIDMEARDWYKKMTNINKEEEVEEKVTSSCIQLPQVVYLDPMYSPDTVGKKALVKKEMQMLHRVLGEEEGLDEENNKQLFEFAQSCARSRIVVKRSISAPPLVQSIPHETISGSSQRFDIYFQNRPILFKR